jgi:hypothetical protein
MFEMMDANHDGKIDQAERDAMKTKWKALSGKHEMDTEAKPK